VQGANNLELGLRCLLRVDAVDAEPLADDLGRGRTTAAN
jgi:hypothetical protein